MAYYRCGGGGNTSVLVEKTITENGIYDPTDDNANGYSLVTVNNPIKTAGNYSLYDDDNLDWNRLYSNSENAISLEEKDLYDDFNFSLGGINFTDNTTVVTPDYSKMDQGEYSTVYNNTSTSALRSSIIAFQPIFIKPNHIPTKISFDLELGDSYSNNSGSSNIDYQFWIGLVSTYTISANGHNESWIANAYTQYNTANTTLLNQEIDLTNVVFSNISKAWLKINASGWTYKINNVEVTYS